MILRNRSVRAAALPVIGMLAACSHNPTPPLKTAPPPLARTVAAPTHDEAIVAIEALLDQGRVDDARRQLAALLATDPADPEAKVLEEGIDGDPIALLGPRNFSYTVATGDTMGSIAAHFLGNKLKFYQLARYNGIAVPAALAIGTELKIPGQSPAEATAPARGAARPSAAASHASRGRGAAVAPPPRGAPAADPAAATRLRAAGLASLNAGRIDRAVALLGRAASLDPGNLLVQRDLARAQRIQRVVQARR